MEKNELYQKLTVQLQKRGISNLDDIRNLLPYWWDDSLKTDDFSVNLLTIHLSNVLDINLAFLYGSED